MLQFINVGFSHLLAVKGELLRFFKVVFLGIAVVKTILVVYTVICIHVELENFCSQASVACQLTMSHMERPMRRF